MTTTQARNVTLYYRRENSDKIYQASIESSGSGFVVNFAYGRRGSTLNTGSKTSAPVDYATASKTFDKLIKDKLAKGYTPGEEGTPYQDISPLPIEPRNTGILPQLLNPIDESEAQELIHDHAWLAQEKFDGRRVLIQKRDTQILGINRRGLVVALPQPIVEQARRIGSQQWLMDGEAIGENYFAFDLLENACTNLRKEPYLHRLKALYELLAVVGGPITPIPTASTFTDKRIMLARLKQEHKEGIVFKRSDSLYIPGRPASGGDQRKLKFTATASCIVAGANGTKRSVALELLEGSSRVGVGNVTIPVNAEIPPAGTIVEVRFLYAYPGGSLYQPVYLGPRQDITVEECRLDQLKFKAEDADDET